VEADYSDTSATIVPCLHASRASGPRLAAELIREKKITSIYVGVDVHIERFYMLSQLIDAIAWPSSTDLIKADMQDAKWQ
jgi:hypothetical protein